MHPFADSRGEEPGAGRGAPLVPWEPAQLEGIIMTDEQDIRDDVWGLLLEGFLTDDEIIEFTTSLFEDESPGQDTRGRAERVTAGLLKDYLGTQAGWQRPTDCDELDQAFEDLRRQDIIAEQHFTCCGSCGHAEAVRQMDEA